MTTRLLGKGFDAAGPAAERAAKDKILSEIGLEYRHDLEESWKLNQEAQSGSNAPSVLHVGNKSDAELPALMQAHADKLSFGNRSDASYHAHKHAGEMPTKPSPENEMTTYLQECRRIIRTHRGKVRANQNGSRSIVIEAEGMRVIITINNGNAAIATFGRGG